MAWDDWTIHEYKCGCACETRSDNWFRGEFRDVRECDTYKELRRKHKEKCHEVDIYNEPINKRLGELLEYMIHFKKNIYFKTTYFFYINDASWTFASRDI